MGSYNEMWQKLNMDLQKHDILCAALPDSFGEIYMTQKNRPDNMNYFNYALAEVHGARIEEIQKSKKNGKKVVGTFCVFVPDEVILAADAVGVGLCSGSQFWVEDGEKVLPRNICPLVKAFMGAKVSRTCPYFQSTDMIVGETTCDAKKKAYEILEEYMPVHVMELPQMKREKDFQEWQDEIKLFQTVLFRSEKLKNSIDLVNKKRRALKRLYDLRKHTPSPISGLDALLVSQVAFVDDPIRFTEKTEELCDELDERIKTMKPNGRKRIMITGTPMSVPNWKIHHIIEGLNAEIVVEETCTGTRYFEKEVFDEGDTIDDLVRNIAERYMNINCACFTPNNDRIDDIIKYAEEYNADGVIYCNLSFCHTYAIEYGKLEKALKENNIPLINIETDYSEEDVGQIRTRVEAFLEMI